MSSWETVFFWCSLMIYCLACSGYIYSFVFRQSRLVPMMTLVVFAGLLAHSLAIAARFSATGHLPWAGDYESALMGGWFIIAGTLIAGARNKSLQGLASVTVPLVILMMGYGFTRNPVLAPLAASLATYWLYIHVYFAWLSFGSYVLAMAAGVLFLLKRKSEAQPEGNPFFDRFPSLERLDELIFQYVLFGFVTNSLMLVAGSMWAKDLWGSYWNWDPVETWSLVSYLIYGIAIHLRVTFGWRDSRMAWMVIASLSTVIITFFGVSFMVSSSQHIFNVPPMP